MRADPRDYFDAAEVARSKAYQRPVRRAGLLGAAAVLLAMLALIALRVPATVVAATRVGPWPARLALVALLTMLVVGLVGLPFALWEEFVHEKRWGFSRVTPRLFVADAFKGMLLGYVLLTGATEVLWWLMRLTSWWWLLGAAVVTLIGIVLSTILPTLIVPMFNRLEPLAEPGLRERLQALAERAGVRLSGYLVMDASKRTTKDNAFFAGMGRTRRVIVFDNLLSQGHDAVEVVVAHEIGHWRRRHILRQLPLEMILTLLTFAAIAAAGSLAPLMRAAGVLTLSDPAALPLFLLLYAGLGVAAGLVSAWQSRWIEREADLDALELTGAPAAYRQLWRSMAARNLPDLDPSWWARLRASHPPVAERIRFGDLWEAASASAAPPR